MEKPIIGRLEKVNLPGLDLIGLDAKIDTGAYSCSLHCSEITHADDKEVSFKLCDEDHPAYHGKSFTFPISRINNVKSSTGVNEERIFIKTTIEIGGKKIKSDISLTDRSNMTYPMLIGRRLLNGKFLVDVSLNNFDTEEDDT